MLRCGMHRGTDPSLPPRVNHLAPARPPRLPPSRVAPRVAPHAADAVGRSFLTRRGCWAGVSVRGIVCY